VRNESGGTLDIGTPSLKITEMGIVRDDPTQTYGFDSVHSNLKVISDRIVKHNPDDLNIYEAICGVGRNSGKYYFEVRVTKPYPNLSVGLSYNPIADSNLIIQSGYSYISQGRIYKNTSPIIILFSLFSPCNFTLRLVLDILWNSAAQFLHIFQATFTHEGTSKPQQMVLVEN